MGAVLGTVTAAALLAAAGGTMSHLAASDNVRDVAPNPTVFTQPLEAFPYRESVGPDGLSGYTTVIEQVGKIVSISDRTLTAASTDGTIRTYVITPRTTAVTLGTGQNPGANLQFSVDEVVTIVGTVTDGTAVATVVAEQATANGNGPPMDG
jgi:hypothetical protein